MLYVVLPVVEGLVMLKAADQVHHLTMDAYHPQGLRIDLKADNRIDPFTRHAVAFALEVVQRCCRHPGGLLYIAVKWFGKPHQPCSLILQDVCHSQFRPVRMGQFTPAVLAGLI